MYLESMQTAGIHVFLYASDNNRELEPHIKQTGFVIEIINKKLTDSFLLKIETFIIWHTSYVITFPQNK